MEEELELPLVVPVSVSLPPVPLSHPVNAKAVAAANAKSVFFIVLSFVRCSLLICALIAKASFLVLVPWIGGYWLLRLLAGFVDAIASLSAVLVKDDVLKPELRTLHNSRPQQGSNAGTRPETEFMALLMDCGRS